MKIAERIKTGAKTRAFQIVFGLLCLAAGVLFVGMALDSGSLLDYAIAILFAIIGIRELWSGIFKRIR